MKINLEVLHSCTIKRKKPWPKISWIGKEKEQLFILDNQRISIIDPKNGKTKKRISKLKSFIKSIVSYNVSDNGIYLVAILNNGDLIIWNKDTNTINNVSGMAEFAYKLGFHCPSVFISDDMRKIILITSRNKVFVWESDRLATDNPNLPNQTIGNWSDIVASKDVKTVEDSKELVLHVRFTINLIDGVSATCCFAFNYENKPIVNVVKIRWINPNEITSSSQCRFETVWICHQPNFFKFTETISTSMSSDPSNSKFNCLYTRGAYVIKLSHNANILALACNQKQVENGSLVFMSPTNGALIPVNLRNFGLNVNAKGRNYWIQDLCWMFNDLYLAGITKHGAIFLVTRLGHPLFIHAVGKEINMGPALFLTLHPLIIIRGKSTSVSQSGDASLSSTIENEDNLRQRYSLARHPTLPIFACSDGFLMCIFKIQLAFSTQSRLIRELVHETIGLLNSGTEKLNSQNDNLYILKSPFDPKQESDEIVNPKKPLKRRVSFSSNDQNIPDWGLQTTGQLNQSEKSSDSGVDSNNELKNKSRSNSIGNQKIAEGKIIFSFLPQILPISLETVETDSLASKLETSFEYLQSSWSLLVSMQTSDAALSVYECDQIAKSIQQAFTHFSYLFLKIDSISLRELKIYKNEFARSYGSKLEKETSNEQKIRLELRYEEEFKIKVLVDLFVRMLKFLYFDPASKHNPNSHMTTYISRFTEKFIQSLLKFENVFVNDSNYSKSRISLLGLVYSLLHSVENLVKSIYKFKQNELFFLNTDSVMCQKCLDETKNLTLNRSKLVLDNKDNEPNSDKVDSEKIDTDSLEKTSDNKNLILVKSNRKENIDFIDLIFEKCWNNLLHYAYKYRNTLEILGSIREKQLNDLDIYILLLERRLQKFPSTIKNNGEENSTKILPIYKKSQLFKINKADMIYLDFGNVDAALEVWLAQLNSIFDELEKINKKSKSKSISNNSNVDYLTYKSVKIVHKIFYACLANYKIKKLLIILNKIFSNEYSKYNYHDANETSNSNPFSLFSLNNNTFKNLQPPKPLQKVQIAIVSVIKSLARFMSNYLTNNMPLFIYSVNNPIIIPSIIEDSESSDSNSLKIELSKEKLTSCINQDETNDTDDINLSSIFTADKTTELFLITGLYDEAIYFLNLINDWKSSFLICSILKESKNYERISYYSNLPFELQSEQILVQKLCSLLGIEKILDPNKLTLDLAIMEKSYLDSVSSILKELLLCSVMTKSNVLENMLTYLMELLVFYVSQISSNSVIVPEDFYLPSPPIYCAQIHTGDEHLNQNELALNESKLRLKLCVLCKCIIVLLTSSNLYVPLIKWYLEQLIQAESEMKQKHGLNNLFQMNLPLSNLLSSIRYQKLGYIPENLFFLFRDFCAILFYLDLRDRFTLALREYSRHLIKTQIIDFESNQKNISNSDSLIKISLKMIDYGNMMLSYRSFLKNQHMEIQDIVLSAISRLTQFNQHAERNLYLEQKLAVCVEKKPYRLIQASELNSSVSEFVSGGDENTQIANQNFQIKLKKLLDEWKNINSRVEISNQQNGIASMSDVYQHSVLVNTKSNNAKLQSIYGVGEDSLQRIYMQKLSRVSPSVCGGYDFERTYWLADYLELLFKFGFDNTENWDSIVQSVNQTPLLPEFYETIRQKELPNSHVIEKQYIVKSNEILKKNKVSEIDLDESYLSSVLFNRKQRTALKLNNSSASGRSLIEELNLESNDLKNTSILSSKKGLFRSYSFKSLNDDLDSENQADISKLRKSVSFSNLKENESNLEIDANSVVSSRNEKKNFKQLLKNKNLAEPLDQPLKLLDFGSNYIETSNLALWLIKWSTQFQKVLMANSKTSLPFWQNKSEYESKITLRLTSLNANMLVGSVYMADGNNLETISQSDFIFKIKKEPKAKPKAEHDEEFTQVSSSTTTTANKNIIKNESESRSLMLKKFKNDESSESTTLDISSLTENQIKNYFNRNDQHRLEKNKKQQKEKSAKRKEDAKENNLNSSQYIRSISQSKSPNRSILNKTRDDSSFQDLSSAHDITQYYDLTSFKNAPVNLAANTSTNQLEKNKKESEKMQKDEDEDDKNKSKKGIRLGSLEFLTNIFKSKKENSQSPNHSRSPTKLSRNATPSPVRNADKPKSILNSVENSSNFPFPAPLLDSSSKGPFDVHQIIREELKKIVQIQHNTVMNFLNNGAPASDQNKIYQNQLMVKNESMNNIDQQLVSILKQQKFQQNPNAPPVEFVIETKIKTVDSLSGKSNTYPSILSSSTYPNHESENQFYSNTEVKKDYFMKTFDKENDQVQKLHKVHQSKKSSFIKIPLLNSNYSSQKEQDPQRQFNLPLIDENKPNRLRSPQSIKTNSNNQDLPLLDFRSDKHLKQPQFAAIDNYKKISKKVEIKIDRKEGMNKHIKEFIEKTNQTSITKYKNFPLLNFGQETETNLNLNTRQEKTIEFEETSNEKVQRSIQTSFISTQKSEEKVEKESKEIQVQKPMYDGYIIAPGAFDDMLNQENEQISATSALAHYNSTQHLRETEEARRLSLKNKKTTYTMTDNISNAYPIAPDILFKLQFDANRKDRQVNDRTTESIKDYVNIADMDSNAVQDVLKLIEHEQNKREGKYVPIKEKVIEPSKDSSPKRKVSKETNEKLDVKTEKSIDYDINLENTVKQNELDEKQITGDLLTEKLLNFSKTEDEWKEYDEIMKRQIEESNKLAESSINKRKMVNELKFIDEKIKLMNEMANEMNNDYTKYTKIAEQIQELGNQREMIEKYQRKMDLEQERLSVEEKKRKGSVQFYQRETASDLINDLKNKVIKPRSKDVTTSKVQPKKEFKTIEKPKTPTLTSTPTPAARSKQKFIDKDEDLSDLKDDEEEKLKKLLKASQSSLNLTNDSKMDTANSVTNILRDVFDEFKIDNIEDLDSDKLDEILDRSMSPKRPIKKANTKPKADTSKSKLQVSSALNQLKPSTSPIRSRKEIENTKTTKTLNKTYSKTPRKFSPVVNKEKVISEKREMMQEKFSIQREEEAKNLIQEIMIDNAEMAKLKKISEENNLRNKSPGSPLNIKRNKSISPVLSNRTNSKTNTRSTPSTNTPPVPPLPLYSNQIDLITAEKSLENKKPSLMAKTILDLKNKEKQKKIETEQLLRDLEDRAKFVVKPPSQENRPLKVIQPFTNYVHLQEPNKLRDHPDHKPLTYTEQLMMHQENTVVQESSENNINELYKVYGTRRVKGVYKNYVKDTPRKVKSYSDRLKELKPAESQALIKNSKPIVKPTRVLIGKQINNRQVKSYSDQLKELQKNKQTIGVKKENNINRVKKPNQNYRFSPYKTNFNDEKEIEKIDELLQWTLDDKIKNIIYDNNNTNPVPKSKISHNTNINAAKHVTYKEADQDTLADTDGDYMLDALLEDEKQNEQAFKNILKDIAYIEKREGNLVDDKNVKILDEDDDYINQVNLDDLKNISLSSESALSSFIDWNDIDNMIGKFK